VQEPGATRGGDAQEGAAFHWTSPAEGGVTMPGHAPPVEIGAQPAWTVNGATRGDAGEEWARAVRQRESGIGGIVTAFTACDIRITDQSGRCFNGPRQIPTQRLNND
jgi:hypothetical protein